MAAKQGGTTVSQSLYISEVPEYKVTQRPWTEQEDSRYKSTGSKGIYKMVELRKFRKSWVEICKALHGTHTHMDCRTHWFNYFWDEFNNSNVNGEIDGEKLNEGKINGEAEEGGADEMDDGETDAEGDTEAQRSAPKVLRNARSSPNPTFGRQPVAKDPRTISWERIV